ncbi:hypothetical protein K466DRAFT_609594 [Polyporus arcularius HHB13444]|uniref:Uncharacterized protein n=1 Tax=Polyporus arcularius HHB13444 TaxID=1314778 RepID=A0A5C3NTS6_9APHY|nr:hypothetical protein K466DRAFT_609594 [Polyporus arcularius HHB13444]
MPSISAVSPLQPLPPPDDGDQNTNVVDMPPSAVAVERLFNHLSRSSAILRALRDFDSANHEIKRTIENLAGGDARVQLLQDYFLFISNARLRTFVLRIQGRTSGIVAEKFIQWVRAFERGDFGVPDAITTAQRELLVDFAHIWEGFARLPRLDRGWEYFRLMLRWLSNESWVTNPVVDDGGFVQLSMLSEWAHEQYPQWFEVLEDDPEMPDLVSVYGSDSEDEAHEDAGVDL